jgi:hypothetical protein
MKEKFVDINFKASSIEMLQKVNSILKDYENQGYQLSLRQLYYQLVARDIVENSVRSYKNIGRLISDARQAGLIDWNMIEDRNRATVFNSHWTDPGSIIKSAAYSFRIDKWQDQPWHIEVMVEKDALSGVLEPVCRDLDIRLTANKGYSSSSMMYFIGKRLRNKRLDGKKILVIYLGDHDPSGIDMTRDIEERLQLYAGLSEIKVSRLALNMDQVETWNPPENPAKTTDSRFDKYLAEFGESSWELDAVEPRTLARLVIDDVKDHRDEKIWTRSIMRESEMKLVLEDFAENWDER